MHLWTPAPREHREKPQDHLSERKDRAIDVAIEALRALFEVHPSLLREPERGMRLILGLSGND
jgi:hypothetical protein